MILQNNSNDSRNGGKKEKEENEYEKISIPNREDYTLVRYVAPR